METITLAQLRAAFILWEMDVRANADDFKTSDESRATPLEEAADAYINVVRDYIAKASAA